MCVWWWWWWQNISEDSNVLEDLKSNVVLRCKVHIGKMSSREVQGKGVSSFHDVRSFFKAWRLLDEMAEGWSSLSSKSYTATLLLENCLFYVVNADSLFSLLTQEECNNDEAFTCFVNQLLYLFMINMIMYTLLFTSSCFLPLLILP